MTGLRLRRLVLVIGLVLLVSVPRMEAAEREPPVSVPTAVAARIRTVPGVRRLVLLVSVLRLRGSPWARLL